MRRFALGLRIVAGLFLAGGFAALFTGHFGAGWAMAALATAFNTSPKVVASYSATSGPVNAPPAHRVNSREEPASTAGLSCSVVVHPDPDPCRGLVIARASPTQFVPSRPVQGVVDGAFERP